MFDDTVKRIEYDRDECFKNRACQISDRLLGAAKDTTNLKEYYLGADFMQTEVATKNRSTVAGKGKAVAKTDKKASSKKPNKIEAKSVKSAKLTPKKSSEKSKSASSKEGVKSTLGAVMKQKAAAKTNNKTVIGAGGILASKAKTKALEQSKEESKEKLTAKAATAAAKAAAAKAVTEKTVVAKATSAKSGVGAAMKVASKPGAGAAMKAAAVEISVDKKKSKDLQNKLAVDSQKSQASVETQPEMISKEAAVEIDTEAATTKTKAKAKSKEALMKKISSLTDDLKKWTMLKEEHGSDEAAKYNMSQQYLPNQPISHPKLGWGFILNNNNDRLEVLFESGIKILISNYNSER